MFVEVVIHRTDNTMAKRKGQDNKEEFEDTKRAGATSGARTAYPSGAPEFTPGF
jgi:hypothetical protein